MRTTLFYIPHAIGDWPVFGAGGLLVWIVLSLGWLAWQVRRYGWTRETLSSVPILALVGVAIVYVLPSLEEVPEVGPSKGLPIRGYGVMVLCGVVAGLVLAVRQARRMGVDPEVIFSLSFAVFVVGIIGARVFYVVEYWPQYRSDDWRTTLIAIVNVTQGGLVVYGSLCGGALGGLWFLRRHGLPVLALADLMAPSLLVGLALGRLGCLLNGCCYGGLCEHGLAFPADSPPYKHQRSLGQLHGFRLAAEPRTGAAVVQAVELESPAAVAGLQPGSVIRAIDGRLVATFPEACERLEIAPADVTLDTDRGRVRIVQESLPAVSLPVYPTQIYAAIGAALLALVLWSWYPFRRRDGEVLAVLLTLYPLVRIVEELLRTDEPGQFHTPLTIAQWISLLLLVAVAGFWAWLLRQPPGSVLPPADGVVLSARTDAA
jgi:phosphatidylglycerol:prolipoprotein diacylglycerol transferase